MANFIPFALLDIGEEGIQVVIKILRFGCITTWSRTKEFERELAPFLGGEVDALHRIQYGGIASGAESNRSRAE